jgi:hypothetical protein
LVPLPILNSITILGALRFAGSLFDSGALVQLDSL